MEGGTGHRGSEGRRLETWDQRIACLRSALGERLPATCSSAPSWVRAGGPGDDIIQAGRFGRERHWQSPAAAARSVNHVAFNNEMKRMAAGPGVTLTWRTPGQALQHSKDRSSLQGRLLIPVRAG